MCTTCGCSASTSPVFTAHPSDESLAPVSERMARLRGFRPATKREAAMDAPSAHARQHGTTVRLEAEILGRNNAQAQQNRQWLARQRVLALNLVSSPGSGKTTILERSIKALAGKIPISVIEGDQETVFDAERIRAAGANSVQVNTGSGCHLESDMVATALARLRPPAGSVVMIENVGNLVCPALFDLGEFAKVVILSVTEGADKPLKYPHMFRAARLMLLNKVDLLPYVDFDVERCIACAREVNPEIDVLPLSATRGDGMDAWLAWIADRMPVAEHASE